MLLGASVTIRSHRNFLVATLTILPGCCSSWLPICCLVIVITWIQKSVDVKLNIRLLVQMRIFKHSRIKKIGDLRYLSGRMHDWYLVDDSVWLLIMGNIVRIKILLTAVLPCVCLVVIFLQAGPIRRHRAICCVATYVCSLGL